MKHFEIKHLVGKTIKEVDAWIAKHYPTKEVDKFTDAEGYMTYYVGGYWADDALAIEFDEDMVVDTVDYQGDWD